MKKILSILLTIAVVISCACVYAFSESAMKLTDETYPTEIVKGNTFSAYGIVTSSYNIVSVTMSVTNSDGETEFTYTGKPYTKSYDIHNVDYLLTFSKLDLGDYTYKIVASDTQTKDEVLLSKDFKVVAVPSQQSIKLTDANYPQTIKQGNTFSVYGTVSSEKTLTAVTCAVHHVDGTMQFTKTVEPGTSSYSISNIDKYMTFSRLTAGKYVYSITASDSVTKDAVLLSEEFTVISDVPTQTLTLTSANYPTSLTVGNTFSVNGTVNSEGTISAVTVGVYNTSGTAQFSYTAKPGTKSYDIHTIDYLMTFSKLAVGTYVYRITASDTYSKDVVLLEKSFTVTSLYTPESEMESVNWKVIDISKWNEFTSWDNVAKAVDGVIIRVGYRSTGSRTIGSDVKFESNYTESEKRNLHIGCYFFSNALSEQEAIEEADFVLNAIKKYNCKFDMPIYFDMETDAQVALSASAATKIARAFCNRISEAGYMPGIYCNKYFARDELNASQLNDISFWIAEYADNCTYNGPYGMWQFSEKGNVSGISGYVDLNYCYYDYPSYIKAKGLNGFTPTVTAPPEVKIISKNGSVTDEDKKIIYGIPHGLTSEDFTKTYVSASSGVEVVYTNTVGGKIATGTKITFKFGSETLAEYNISVVGDVDGNAVLTSSDALAVLQHIVNKKELSELKKLSSDVNKDGVINASDALEILLIICK